MDKHEPVCVYTVTDSLRAEVVRNFLQSEGIRCYLDGANAATQLPINAIEVRVMVDAAHADKARKLLEEHEPPS